MSARQGRGGGTLRIIGGEWRGRKFRFRDGEGLRPTADRVRETLFNWLAMDIHGAHCLDLYAGSGALGLEALSRGAASCILVDNSERACADIRSRLSELRCERGKVHRADALSFLERTPTRDEVADIVFLDPPFGRDLLGSTCRQLESGGWLRDEARIYLERARREPEPVVPQNWLLHREKTAGEVCYQLFVRDPQFV